MLTKEGQFFHYEPPYLTGEVLTFPNDPGGAVAIERLGSGKVVNWNGRAGDTVRAKAGTEFRPLEGPVNYVYTLRDDGWLDFRLSPRQDLTGASAYEEIQKCS